MTDALTLRTVMTAILDRLKALLVFAIDNSCMTSRGKGDGWKEGISDNPLAKIQHMFM